MASKIDKLSSNNLMVVMLLVSLLVVGVTVLASKSLIRVLARDYKVVQKKTAADNTLKIDLANAPSLVSQNQGLGDKKAVLADALPDTVDFPSLLVTLENMAASSGQKLKTVNPAVAITAAAKVGQSQGDAPAPQPYQFTISTSGNYDGMIRMVHAIENSARPMRVVEAQFAGGGSALNGDFTIETYSQDKAKLPFSTEIVK